MPVGSRNENNPISGRMLWKELAISLKAGIKTLLELSGNVPFYA